MKFFQNLLQKKNPQYSNNGVTQKVLSENLVMISPGIALRNLKNIPSDFFSYDWCNSCKKIFWDSSTRRIIQDTRYVIQKVYTNSSKIPHRIFPEILPTVYVFKITKWYNNYSCISSMRSTRDFLWVSYSKFWFPWRLFQDFLKSPGEIQRSFKDFSLLGTYHVFHQFIIPLRFRVLIYLVFL